MKNLSLFLLAFVFAFTSSAQLGGAKATASLNLGNLSLDEDRYEGVEKSPYLFKEFAPAKVYDAKKDKWDSYSLNFNGYTGQFEFAHNGATYELDDTYYDIIEIAKCEPNPDHPEKFTATSVRFEKGVDPTSPNTFQMLVHENDEMALFKKYESKLVERKSTDTGTGIKVTKFFAPMFSYYIVKDGDKNQVRLNKKFTENLDNEEITAFVKKNKMKLNSEKELKELLLYYDDVTMVDSTVAKADSN